MSPPTFHWAEGFSFHAFGGRRETSYGSSFVTDVNGRATTDVASSNLRRSSRDVPS